MTTQNAIDVALVRDVIDESRQLDFVATPSAGAILSFRGVVRDHHHGKAVQRLDYTAYDAMALSTMREIGEDLVERWPLHRVSIAHRLGTLEIGEASISIVLSLSHRKEGFDALEYAIDRFKQIVPIWKKEHFVDGVSEWVHQDW